MSSLALRPAIWMVAVKLRFDGPVQRVIRHDDWKVLGPLAGEVLRDLKGRSPGDELAGPAAMAEFADEFVSRACAAGTVLPEAAPALHRFLWSRYEGLEQLEREAETRNGGE